MGEANRVKWLGVRPTDPIERLSIVWDYADSIINESVKNTDTIAGSVAITSTAVPAGEIHVINHIVAFNTVSAVTTCNVYHRSGAANFTLRRVSAPAQNAEIIVATPIVIMGGDDIRAYFIGCILHDNIQLHISGYKLSL